MPLFNAKFFQAGEVCGPSGIDAALETVQGLDRQLSDYCNDAKSDRLQPLPGQTMKSCAQELGATSKTVGASMAQLLTAAAQVFTVFYVCVSSVLYNFKVEYFK